MNETKPTPGPWNAGTVEGNETRYVQPYFSGSGRCIGVVYGDIDHKWTDEHRANAQLIAAAPELLEALGGLVNCHTGAAWQTEAVRREWWLKGVAAIAKAKGE